MKEEKYMTVKDIVKGMLESMDCNALACEKDEDGDFCACFVDDLCPCGSFKKDCIAVVAI